MAYGVLSDDKAGEAALRDQLDDPGCEQGVSAGQNTRWREVHGHLASIDVAVADFRMTRPAPTLASES